MPEPPLYAARYPGYDVLAKRDEWDPVTRSAIEARVGAAPSYRFFTREEAAVLSSLADVVLPQDDRPPNLRIPIVPPLDARLEAGRGQGFRYEELPPDREFWRALVRALDDEARAGWQRPFLALRGDERRSLVAGLAAGRARAGAWRSLPLPRAWSVVLTEFVSHYYGHPYSWNEIGFGGPKFPRIYPRPARDNPDEAFEPEAPP